MRPAVTAPSCALPPPRIVTILAVHGNGGGAHRFARIVEHFPPDVRLSAVTLPGFARVPANPALRSLADYAALLARWVRAVPRPRVLLGHGIGGSIVLELVQRHASDLDGVILHAPVGTRLERRIFPRLMALPGAREAGRRVLAARLWRPILRRLIFSPAVPVAFTDRFFNEYGHCAVFSQMFDLIAPAWFRGLRPVALPSALLWGADERLLSVDQVDDYRVLLPGALVRVVPGWGHFPMIEQPRAYAEEVATVAQALVRQPRLRQ
jgi:pimeloyl-ACP methyl ester carboxylesterase